MRRELRSLRNEAVRGAVVLNDDGSVQFDELASEVFAQLRSSLGDPVAAKQLMDLGWSNGHTLYLADPQ